MSSAPKSRRNRPHYVYRCYDRAGTLLYIGCTEDVVMRMQVHASAWQNPASAVLSMRMDRYEVEEFASFDAARDAERQAIHDEAPLTNTHHQRVRVGLAERNRRIDEYLESTRPPIDPEWANFGLDGMAS